MPIAAAVGGGLLLLIIIVVVVLKRRSRTPQAKARSVVAFENPMYDAPRGTSSKKPVDEQLIYDNNDHHGEGLYDEPSFLMKAEKSNPIFNSNENLNATETDEFGQVVKALTGMQGYDEPAGFMQSSSDDHGITGFDMSHDVDVDAMQLADGYLDIDVNTDDQPYYGNIPKRNTSSEPNSPKAETAQPEDDALMQAIKEESLTVSSTTAVPTEAAYDAVIDETRSERDMYSMQQSYQDSEPHYGNQAVFGAIHATSETFYSNDAAVDDMPRSFAPVEQGLINEESDNFDFDDE